MRVFLDIALKIQGANWIPGALHFSDLYTYQVTAVERLVVTKQRHAKDEAPEVLLVLEKGQSVVATEVVKLYSRPDLIDALMHHEFTNERVKSMPECLKVNFGEDHSFESGYIDPTHAQVTCVPVQESFREKFFRDLPTIPWAEKYDSQQR